MPRAVRLEAVVSHAAHLLPDQGPIEIFVHHNTLHAFESMPFHDAIAEASQVLGVAGLWPRARYLELRREGRIDDASIAEAKRMYLARHGPLPAGLALPAEQILDAAMTEVLTVYGSEAELAFAIDEEGLLDAPGARALFVEAARLSLRKPLRPRHVVHPLPRWLLMRAGAPDSAEQVNPVMVRLTSAYLDFALARRAWPERSRGFLRGWQSLVLGSRAPVPDWQASIREAVEADVQADRSAADIVLLGLDELGVVEGHWEEAIRELLLMLPGWAGIMSRLERVPADRPLDAAPASLMEYLAVRLRHDLASWRHLAVVHLGHQSPLASLASRVERRRGQREVLGGGHECAHPLFRLASRAGLGVEALGAVDRPGREALLEALAQLSEQVAPRILHDAYELHYADRFLGALASPARRPRPRSSPSMQVVTCIDDREESFRRAIEEVDGTARTFATAGFFGLPIAFRGLDELDRAALCPVVQTPQLDVEEAHHETDAAYGAARARRRSVLGRLEAAVRRGTRSLTWGVVLTPIVGLFSAVPFAARVLFPRATARVSRVAHSSLIPQPRTRLAPVESGRALGLEERAGRVHATLSGMGMVADFADVVVMLGHGSSSLNNPHRSAYDCGACGGRHGGPNARYFASLANDPEVRAELKNRGVEIPERTWFVGGAHDTATDAVQLYDLDDVPERAEPALVRAREVLEAARRRSAHERCRRFESAPRALSIEGGLRHVEARSEDLSQARPELGHVANAACVVGRREATEGLFLDRRSFLVSYDPHIDPDGRILERTLVAVGPVGAGISLEYFFSTVDNERLGAGTKLPHNVAGLFGVMEGSESDLRTGLPRQMIEIHEPMRLLLVCETPVEIMRAILERNTAIRGLVEGEWVRLVTLDPETRALHMAGFGGKAGELVSYAPRAHPLPVRKSSREHYAPLGRAVDGFLGFAQIEWADVQRPAAASTRASSPEQESVRGA